MSTKYYVRVTFLHNGESVELTLRLEAKSLFTAIEQAIARATERFGTITLTDIHAFVRS